MSKRMCRACSAMVAACWLAQGEPAQAQPGQVLYAGPRGTTVMAPPPGPGRLDPISVATYWGFWPNPILARQPIGHQIIATSPNGYVYRPVYADDATAASIAWPGPDETMTGPLAQSRLSARAGTPPLGANRHIGAQRASVELLDTALRLFKEGRYQAVIDRINRLLDLEPAQADALLLLVQCQFALGNYAEATEALAAALANAPKYDWGKYARGYQKVFPSVLRFTLHLRALERFTEAHPERSEGHLLLGYQYASLGEFDRALAEFARARPSVEADRLASHFAEVRDAPAPVPDPELNAEPEAGKVPLKRRGQEF